MNETSQKFHWASVQYDNDSLLDVILENKFQLLFLTDSLLRLQIESSERDACSFWIWCSGQLDAGFIDIPKRLDVDFLEPLVEKFLEKFYKD